MMRHLLGVALAILLSSSKDDLPDTYDECKEHCVEIYRECIEKRCAALPAPDKPHCFMECAGGDYHKCNEACNDKPRL